MHICFQSSSLDICFERGLANFKLEIILRIHEVESSRQRELRNYFTQKFIPTLATIEMEVETQVLFATSRPSVGMFESIPLNPNATPNIIKQKLKKVNIVIKF